MNSKKKIVIIATVPGCFLNLIAGLPHYLSNYYDVTIITSPGNEIKQIQSHEGVRVKPILMTRSITPIKDLVSLIKLLYFFLTDKPDIIYSFTPKAGLLSMLAGFFARVPIRIHNVVGLPLMEKKGIVRRISVMSEKVTYFFSTKLLCNSYGLREYINKNLSKHSIEIIGDGSINGINTELYKNTLSEVEITKARKALHIDEKDFVLIFVGRIVRDKGVNELIQAFSELNKPFPQLKLLMVGQTEMSLDPIAQETIKEMEKNKNIICVGHQSNVRAYLSVADAFILPSYREGLPNSLIEAGSYGLPLLASDINGCNEVIQDEINGFLFEKKSVAAIKEAVTKILINRELYLKLKNQVRASIVSRYAQDTFWGKFRAFLSTTGI